mmetsp:Transcript_35145/g.89367  ORF Transcript_35145/g.89367 Transcript_35145/m.89367 type:complete len:343 (-) Transcript_35145:62-1090(-)|eukprot:CAMPEP_0183439420 /NCGR_PEP_ID=MMETSP0370-20130417/78109_1 /TAXON_ID=268820 /ORGANISM="Peridinium aciculiferum, Strain PAER-2" /LENGTH=342 /DNA_ID=CAMNT_0025627899 /DNA_START=67 /DNA_END=1095 /DNA_ORIENTATION=-
MADDPCSPKRAKIAEEALSTWLSASDGDHGALARIDEIVDSFGVDALKVWTQAAGRHTNNLVQTLACKGWCSALEHLASKHELDLDAKRPSDGCTAAHLAVWYQRQDVYRTLARLGADVHIKNNYGETADEKMMGEREKYENLIFLDLELTRGFYDRDQGPAKILEAAIVVVGKDLSEKGRGQWVVGGYSKEELLALGDFHQQHFRDAAPGGQFPPLEDAEGGGNGLFTDIAQSDKTLEQVEEAMLALVRKHCPEGACPLVGYSVQCDREVLMLQMPKFYSFLSHQIVDISSFLRMGKTWLPEKMKLREKRESKYNHRALNDVEDSIETLAWVRDNLFQSPT